MDQESLSDPSYQRLLEALAAVNPLNPPKGTTAVGAAFGGSPQLANNWPRRGVPHARMQEAQARWQINSIWLATGEGEMLLSDGKAAAKDDWKNVRGFDQKAALGDGAIQDDYAETHALKFKASSLRRKGLSAERLAVYYGDGDSMEPTIEAGDAILFDTSDTRLQDGKIFMVRYDGHITAKRLLKLGRAWFMSSDNVADPKWRKPVPIDETKDFEVIGRVRWIAGWED